MEKLVALVKEKTGITAEQATGAVETVLKFLKDKLPGPLGGQIDNALKQDESGGNAVSKAIGNILGK
jgi:hypothetical protein